ncbi:hypothetical protein J7643_03735 [bacterium]|nr:hypothetical protein [bacterium]
MADTNSVNSFETFKLGPLELSGFEVPELIPLGGEQAHAVKDFPGGDRQVQSFGYHRRPLTWSGILVGPEALQRHQALEALCDAGLSVRWSFGNQLADVLITRYHPELLDRFEVHYSLEMIVILDHARPPVAETANANSQILAGLQQAAAAFEVKVGPWPPSSLATLFAQWAVDMDWLFPWTDQALDSLSFLTSACEALEAGLEAFIQPLASDATIVADLEALLAASEALSGVRSSRMAIATHLLGAAAPGIWAAGTSVWELGSRLYGDASRGLDILTGNNLCDPAITAPVQLTIPPQGVSRPSDPSRAFIPQVS